MPSTDCAGNLIFPRQPPPDGCNWWVFCLFTTSQCPWEMIGAHSLEEREVGPFLRAWIKECSQGINTCYRSTWHVKWAAEYKKTSNDLNTLHELDSWEVKKRSKWKKDVKGKRVSVSRSEEVRWYPAGVHGLMLRYGCVSDLCTLHASLSLWITLHW